MANKGYKRMKNIFQKKYRNKVLEWCGDYCAICKKKEHLHLAHITSVIAFVKKFGMEGMEKAYRKDNMMILCSYCHRAYHKKPINFVNGKPRWDNQRCKDVVIKFNELKKARGWKTVDELKEE